MAEIKKKIVVTVDIIAKVKEWNEAGRPVFRKVCLDLGCLTDYFTPYKDAPCSIHAWPCPGKIDRENVVVADLEEESPAPVKPSGLPDVWEIITLDVWGNEKDGWELNNAHRSGRKIKLEEEYKDRDVRDLLVQAGFLNKTCQLRHLEIDSENEQMITVDQKKNGYMLFQLHKMPYDPEDYA